MIPFILLLAGVIDLTTSSTVQARQTNSTAAVPKEKKLQAGEKEAKRLLLLMDKDNNGKISKKEFMDFMEAEFDHLDVNKDGELDLKELLPSRVQVGTRSR